VVRQREKRDGYDGPEEDIQNQMNDMLEKSGTEYRRIPGCVWDFLRRHAPIGVMQALCRTWKSKPDNLILIPVSKKYSLAVEVELKNKNGVMSGGQENYADRMPVTLSRSTKENEEIFLGAMKDAERVRGFLSGLDG
jgi:hypothetical protein